MGLQRSPDEKATDDYLEDEYLKVDAAAVVTDLLWPWAPLIVVGTRCTCAHDNKTQNCTGPAHAPPQCQLNAWHSGSLVLTGAWFQE